MSNAAVEIGADADGNRVDLTSEGLDDPAVDDLANFDPTIDFRTLSPERQRLVLLAREHLSTSWVFLIHNPGYSQDTTSLKIVTVSEGSKHRHHFSHFMHVIKLTISLILQQAPFWRKILLQVYRHTIGGTACATNFI